MVPFATNNISTVNPWWIVGVVDGEGNFSVEIARNATMRLGYQVNLSFNITQHERNRIILDKCSDYFGGKVGGVRTNNKSTGVMMWRVRDRKQIRDIIIPFFDRYPLQGGKDLDYQDFRIVAGMMEQDLHLTADGLSTIRGIAAGMNRGRNKD